ncbi:MAG TPA: tetratricopeptide repeat protein [Chryseolinea sp.]
MKVGSVVIIVLMCIDVYAQSSEEADINNKAVVLMNGEQYKEALPYLDDLVTRDSISTIYRHNRAVTLFNLKKYREALADYEILSAAIPSESEYVFQIGNAYEQLDSAELAVHYYSKAIQLENDKFLYYFKRGTLYLHQGKFKEAENDFNESLLLNPRHDNSLHNRGIALYKLGQSRKACLDWCQAKELGNTYSASHIKANCSMFDPCKRTK